MKGVILQIAIILGVTVYGQNLPDDLQDFGNRLNEIPGLENFNKTVPTVEEIETEVRKKCEKNGGADAFENLQNAKESIQKCFEAHINVTVITEEIEKSKATGSMDEVFAKYCAKRSIFTGCVKNFTLAIEPCLEEPEKVNLQLVLNITENLADFVCYKNGDRIAMFIAEGGLECLDSQKDRLQQCANDTLSHRIPSDLSVNNLPLLVMDSQKCEDFSKLQTCVVTELERCKDNTPANIVDALFKFVRRVLPCNNQNSLTDSAGPHHHIQKRSGNRFFQDLNDMMDNLYEQKCRDVSREAYDNFTRAQSAMKACFQNVRNLIDFKMGIDGKLFCEESISSIRTCIKNFIRSWKACIPQQDSSFVPQLSSDSIDSIYDFLCYNEGEQLNSLKKSQTCLNVMFHSSLSQKVNECRNFSTNNTFASKKNLCNTLDDTLDCLLFRKYFYPLCPDDENVKKFFIGVLNATLSPCSGRKVRNAAGEKNFMGITLNKCLASDVNYDTFAKFDTAVNNYEQCIGNAFQEGAAKPCREIHSQVRYCILTTIKELSPCLSNEEQYFPHFLTDAIESVFNYFCQNDGKIMRSLLQEEGANCTATLLSPEQHGRLDSCMQPIKFVHSYDAQQISLTKAKLCQNLRGVEFCFLNVVSQVCPRDQTFRTIFPATFNALRKPCSVSSTRSSSASITTYNTVILFAVVWFIKIYL